MENELIPQEPNLLTEIEVARLLRCSTSKIRRLRAGGQLAYLKGRPVLIERAALERYLDTIRREPAPLVKPSEVMAEDYDAAGVRARAAYQKYQLRQRNRNK